MLECSYSSLLGDDGSSCTQVVQEYHHGSNLADNYVAYIHLKPREAIAADIVMHFRNYFRATVRGQDPSREDDVEEDTLADLCVQAQDYFLQLFGSQPDFEDEEALEQTFQLAVSADDQAILKRLEQGVSRIWAYFDLPSDQSILTVKASTPSALNIQLKRFTEKRSRGAGALWSIVSIVRTYFDSPLLEQGLVIADCPGLTDKNQERRTGSLRYMSACTAVMIIGAIDRIRDHSSSKEYIIDYVNLKTSSNVFLIVTKCNLSKADEHQLATLEQIADYAEDQENEAQSAVDSASEADQGRLSVALMRAMNHKTEADAALTKAKILVRNKSIEGDLIRQWSKHGPKFEGLNFAFISNEFHRKHIEGYKKTDVPVMNPTEDCFKTIRTLLCDKAQESRFESLARHCSETMLVSINRLISTLEKTPVERKADILLIVDGKTGHEIEPAGQYHRALQSTFTIHVLNAMTDKIKPF